MYAFTNQPQTQLPSTYVQWSSDQRTLKINGRTLRFTRTEYQLLYPLRAGQPIAYEQLSSLVYGCPIDPKIRTVIDKHIDRIRGKMRGSGIYIYCVLGYGYLLFFETDTYEKD